MCNLYRMTMPASEVAAWFDAVEAAEGLNYASEVYPGYPGIVVAEGTLKAMTWGFPLVLKGAKGQPLKPKPVNNTRTDKLATFFWRSSFEERRCLIPLTAWAEAEGAKGRMTRTWLCPPEAPLFAVAGVWRKSEEWGACYSMVMTDSEGSDAAAVHTRMPVLLTPRDQTVWLSGPPDEALAVCEAWTGPLTVNRTTDPWVKGTSSQPDLL